MDYILGKDEKRDKCIFDFEKGVATDKKSLLLFRDQKIEVLLNRYPYANGHLLVAPKRHVAGQAEHLHFHVVPGGTGTIIS